MLYKPLNMQPYLETIDGEIENNFSCQINAEGGTEVTKYKLDIMNIDGNSAYNSGIQDIALPLYEGEVLSVGVAEGSVLNDEEYYWHFTLFEEYAKREVAYGTIQESNSTNNSVFLRKQHYNILPDMRLKIGTEEQNIYDYNSITGVTNTASFVNIPEEGASYKVLSNFIISDESYFSTKTTPSLVIEDFPTPITMQSYKFVGTYSQAENSGWNSFVWNLYDSSNFLLRSSGEVGTGEIEYLFDGLISGQSYFVELIVSNKDGVQVEDRREISVYYIKPELDNVPQTKYLVDKQALKTSWAQPMINLGSTQGSGIAPHHRFIQNAPYIGGCSMEVNEDSTFTIVPTTSSEDIPIPYIHTTFLHMTFPMYFSGDIYKEEAIPIVLKSVSDEEPITCQVGEKYYNTITKLIYTATNENIWGINGKTGDNSCIYQSNSTLYIWKENKLVVTEYGVPFYRVWYSDYVFYYQISNLELQVEGEVSLVDASIDKQWILNPLDAEFTKFYVWDDSAIWDDSLFWHERLTDIVNDSWWKFYLFPTYVEIEGNIINHTNCFDEPGIEMFYDTRLYKDTKLTNINVLYI